MEPPGDGQPPAGEQQANGNPVGLGSLQTAAAAKPTPSTLLPLALDLNLDSFAGKGQRPWPAAPSWLSWVSLPFSFFPNSRPMDDLMPLRLAPLCKESWLLWLLLGLLPWSSAALRAAQRGEVQQEGGGKTSGRTSRQCQSWGVVRGAIRAGDQGDGDCPSLMVIQRSEVSRSLDEVMAVGMESWEGSLTSGLPPGSGLGGRASRAAASWVRKEERSHIVWWLYPLGSVPETLVTEQTVEPSGDRGRDLAAGRAQRGGLGPGEKPEDRPQDLLRPTHLQLPPVLPQVTGLEEREAGAHAPSGSCQSTPRGAQVSEGEGRSRDLAQVCRDIAAENSWPRTISQGLWGRQVGSGRLPEPCSSRERCVRNRTCPWRDVWGVCTSREEVEPGEDRAAPLLSQDSPGS